MSKAVPQRERGGTAFMGLVTRVGFCFTILSAGEPIKSCAVADEKEEMCQVCR